MRRGRLALATCLLLLVGCTSAGVRTAPPPVVPQQTPSTAGSSAPPGSSPLGLKWSWFQPDTFGFVRESGGGWTFQEVEWCDVEPTPGERRWTELDEVVRRAADLGHQLMLKLRTGQCWGTQPPVAGGLDPTEAVRKTPSTPPVDIATYLAYVTELVRRYAARGVHDWAVENEVDVANHWAGDLPSYDALVRAVAPAIRAADPEAHVLDAGVSSTSYGVLVASALLVAGDEAGAVAAYQEHYRRRLAGGASRWPAIASATDLRTVLAGTDAVRSTQAFELAARLVADGVVDAYQLHFYEPAATLPGVLDLVRQRLGDAAVEAWEVGVAWPAGDWSEGAQAAETMRLVALLLGAGVRRIVYLPVAYTEGPRPQVFRGLATPEGDLLAAGRVWRALSDALVGLTEPPVAIHGDLTGVAWTAARDAAVVWASGGAPVTLPDAGDLTLLDASGARVDGSAPIGPEPVLVLGSAGGGLADRLGGTG